MPKNNKKFIVSDFSAIEARVIAWLAGEEWVNEVFASHGKIYEATASQMFDIPIEKIVRGRPEYSYRARGKVATLALGYQGGVGALKAMGADKMGLSDDELEDIKTRWRGANPNIVKLWYRAQEACLKVISTGAPRRVNDLIEFSLEVEPIYGQKFLTITLPSGRSLYYPRPTIEEGNFGNGAMFFMGIGQNRKFKKEQTYGGKLTENIVQAIARDCLAETLIRLELAFPDSPVVMHIHDEVVLEAEKSLTLEGVNKVLSTPIDWAPGLILTADGFESNFYMKD